MGQLLEMKGHANSGEPSGERNEPVTEGHEIQNAVIKQIEAKTVHLVGGENSNNQELRERKKRRKKHADEQRKRIQKLSDQDDDTLISVYEDQNDKIRHQSVLIDRQKQKVKNLKSEINDLNAEFETDREYYLESIRRQEREILLLQSILDRIQPTIRRDCNYYQLHKIKDQSEWDGDRWILPQMKIIKDSLPGLNGSASQHSYQVPSRLRSSPSREDFNERTLERNYSQERIHSNPRISPPISPPKARPFKLRPLK